MQREKISNDSSRNVKNNPRQTESLMYHSHSEQPDKAVLQLLKTLEMDPNFALAHNTLGLAYARLNKFPEAIAEGRKAVDLSGGLSRVGIDLRYSGKGQ